MNRNLIESLENRMLFDVVLADANFDQHVDTADFTVLACNFGQTKRADVAHGDFNQDNHTNALDFNILASQFGAVMANQNWAGTTSTDISGAGTTAWLVAAPTSLDTGVFNSSTWINPPDSDSNPSHTWAGLTVTNFGGADGAIFGNLSISGVLALGAGTMVNCDVHDVGTVMGVLATGSVLSIRNLTGTVSGSNVASNGESDGELDVNGGNGTIEFDNETALYKIDSSFVGTFHANSNKTCSLADTGQVLSASVSITGTGTNSVLTDYAQGFYAGCEGFTVIGGLGQTYHVGDTLTVTYSLNRKNSGFVPDQLGFAGGIYTAGDGVVFNTTTRTISFVIPEEWVTTDVLSFYDSSHTIAINLDTITVSAAAGGAPSQNRLSLGLGLGL